MSDIFSELSQVSASRCTPHIKQGNETIKLYQDTPSFSPFYVLIGGAQRRTLSLLNLNIKKNPLH